MKKIIFWIDDSIYMMDCVVKNLFWDLWDRNCCNRIIFAGDNFKEDGSPKLTITENDKNDFFNEMKKQFVSYCKNRADYENDQIKLWEGKKELFPVEPYYIDETDQDKAKKEILDFLRNDIKKESCDKIYIGLDIRLFEGDKCHKKETKTMELFYELTEEKTVDGKEKYIVFLYSAYVNDDDVKPEWERKYKDYHKDKKDDIIPIYDRYELVSEDIKSEDRENFFKLF